MSAAAKTTKNLPNDLSQTEEPREVFTHKFFQYVGDSLNFYVTQRHMYSLFNYCNSVYLPLSYKQPVFMGTIYTAQIQKGATINRALIT